MGKLKEYISDRNRLIHAWAVYLQPRIRMQANKITILTFMLFSSKGAVVNYYFQCVDLAFYWHKHSIIIHLMPPVKLN